MHFKNIKILGSGEDSIVYLAIKKEQKYALKHFTPLSKRSKINNLDKILIISRKLDSISFFSKNLEKVNDSTLKMEYVEGASLRNYRGTIKKEWPQYIIGSLLQTLYLNIIPVDILDYNIFVTPNHTLKFIDIGDFIDIKEVEKQSPPFTFFFNEYYKNKFSENKPELIIYESLKSIFNLIDQLVFLTTEIHLPYRCALEKKSTPIK